MAERILIASNSHDTLHVEPVAEELARQGHDVIRYEADMVALGKKALSITMAQDADPEVRYEGEILRTQDIGAAWSRRPQHFGPFFSTEDRATRVSLDRETIGSQQLLFDLVPDNRWLNAPGRMKHASRKLTQLALARTIGFHIPTTVVSNEWETITSTLTGDNVVYKPFYSELYNGNELRVVYTNVLENEHDGKPLVDGIPYPGIWQDFKQKYREWRITIIGDSSFDAAIYTDAFAKDDWRRHVQLSGVTFERGDFPDTEKEKCFALLGSLGLRFGTFDFVEQPDGSIVYLEMNPNGQYRWIEDLLNHPISKAVATELAAIAKDQQ